ncbi:MOSC domain-containing protein [Myxacorys almedinensis]|uniref:MOSC domain-containing protein n=1 Tax=Myxacorys almedinensis A TaxID=2690445 RepID=A0A8J8CIQ5_9CYAN|nr:MOSC N-terminal beta barrel domain-containing protein [Myxacorys almedinensis]NDJ17869.1 MOSC domain-containing protein [Myxacorys almedinensis A]
MPTLDRIFIHPIKSLDAVEVRHAKILEGGALEHDREFCMVDGTGKWVNGKRTAKVHHLRSQFNLPARLVTLSVQGDAPVSFHLDHARSAIAAWLSDYFGFSVTLHHNAITGFPDDIASPGPTLISTATLETAASWFENMTVEGMRSRLRTNLEIGGVPAFWEDALYTKTSDPLPFQIGEVHLQGINPCLRCVVPTRDSRSGDPIPQFQKTFAAKRQETLPPWAAANRFRSFYRVAVNTRIAPSEAGRSLRVGDEISVDRLS